MVGILIVAEVEVEAEVGVIVVSLADYIFSQFLYDDDECFSNFLYLFFIGLISWMCALIFLFIIFNFIETRELKARVFLLIA